MKGSWHISAIAATSSLLSIYFSNKLYIITFILWIIYLYIDQRLGIKPILISAIFLIFFMIYFEKDTFITGKKEQIQETKQIMTGEIIRPLKQTTSKLEFTFKNTDTKAVYLVVYFPPKDQVNSSFKINQLKHGAVCTINGKVRVPEGQTNIGQFDYQKYLALQGIGKQLMIASLADISCKGASKLERIYKMRAQLLARGLEKMKPETAAWFNALVLGDDTYLDPEIIELFQRWGLSHILAISGLHIGLVVGLLYFMLIKLNITTKETAQWVIIFLLPIYAVVAGGAPSVWRASLMVLLFTILNKLKFKMSPTDGLSLVFIILLLVNKQIIYHIGFQLSFLVTFGLILSKQWIAESESIWFQSLQISFVSQMMIIPLQLAYFYTFQPLSILLNLIVVPYFTLFVIPLMFIFLLLLPFPNFLTIWLEILFINLNAFILRLIERIDLLLNFTFILGPMPIVIVIIYYLIFFSFMKFVQEKRLSQAIQMGILKVSLICLIGIKPYLSPEGIVTMLDIGQGDAFVIELPYREKVIFIDAGANFSFEDMIPTDRVYRQVIKPYLYARGIRKVDAIFLTHEDLDHDGSVSFMVEELDVDEIIISPFYILKKENEVAWKAAGTKIRIVEAQSNIQVGSQVFQSLGPLRNTDSANDNSLVLYTELGGKNWLFTGDISKGTERELIKTYGDFSVDVLKIAHHGSKTSTDSKFIQAINADYGLLSVGRKNRYGHPAAEVMETLEATEMHILRTDENGAIQYKFRNKQGVFSKRLP